MMRTFNTFSCKLQPIKENINHGPFAYIYTLYYVALFVILTLTKGNEFFFHSFIFEDPEKAVRDVA